MVYIFYFWINEQLYGKYVDVNSLQDTTCSVCMDKLTNPIQLSCGHLFCEDCISQWFEKKTTCPLCRKVIKKGSSWIHSDGSRICSILWYQCYVCLKYNKMNEKKEK